MALYYYLCYVSAYGLQPGSTWGWNDLPRFALQPEPNQRPNPQLSLRLMAEPLDCAAPLPAKKHISIGLNSGLHETSHALVNELIQSRVLMPNKLFHFEYLTACRRWLNHLRARFPKSFKHLNAQKTIDGDFQKHLPVSLLWDIHSSDLGSSLLFIACP